MLCFLSSLFTGSFANRFLPQLPYRLGDHSPPMSSTHSPPINFGAQFPVTPHVLRPQPQMAPIPLNGQSPPQHQPQPPQQTMLGSSSSTGCAPGSPLSPLRIRVSSPTRINADHSSHLPTAGLAAAHNLSSGIIRIASAAAAAQHQHHQQHPQLHQLHHMGNNNTTHNNNNNNNLHLHHLPHTLMSGGATSGAPILHRPFSPSPQPKDISSS